MRWLMVAILLCAGCHSPRVSEASSYVAPKLDLPTLMLRPYVTERGDDGICVKLTQLF